MRRIKIIFGILFIALSAAAACCIVSLPLDDIQSAIGGLVCDSTIKSFIFCWCIVGYIVWLCSIIFLGIEGLRLLIGDL